MSSLKLLLKQTAIFGITTIVVRMLNWLLTPYYTRVLSSPEELGIMTDFFATIAFVNVFLMFGMETTYFRFSSNQDKEKTYKNTQSFVFWLSTIFCGLIFTFSNNIALLMGYEGKGLYIQLFAGILFLDNISNIPFAQIRQENKAQFYFIIRLINILINIGINIFIFSYCIPKGLVPKATEILWIILSNLAASFSTAVLVFPKILKGLKPPSLQWLKVVIPYAFPLVIVGLAGMVNETFDRILLKYLLPGNMKENLYEIGIYSANYKLSIIMSLVIQAFRMALEPYFFGQMKNEDAPRQYANIMTIFNIVCGLVFMLTIFNIELVKKIIDQRYHQGIIVVPILLLANWFLGMYYNTTVWYKITDNTKKGSQIAVLGALITIGANLILIPFLGYLGSAVTTLLAYFSMLIISLILGNKHYKIPYDLKNNGIFLIIVILISSIYLIYFPKNVHLSVILSVILFIITFILYQKKIYNPKK